MPANWSLVLLRDDVFHSFGDDALIVFQTFAHFCLRCVRGGDETLLHLVFDVILPGKLIKRSGLSALTREHSADSVGHVFDADGYLCVSLALLVLLKAVEVEANRFARNCRSRCFLSSACREESVQIGGRKIGFDFGIEGRFGFRHNCSCAQNADVRCVTLWWIWLFSAAKSEIPLLYFQISGLVTSDSRFGACVI